MSWGKECVASMVFPLQGTVCTMYIALMSCPEQILCLPISSIHLLTSTVQAHCTSPVQSHDCEGS